MTDSIKYNRANAGKDNATLCRGVAWGLVLGGMGIAAMFLSGVSAVFPLVALIIVPFAFGLLLFPGSLLTRFMYASVLAFTLELLLGGAGNWSTIFGVPIRYLLLLNGLFFGGLYALLRREIDFPWLETVLIALYGAILPVSWFAYSVLAEGNSPGLAFGDVGFLATLLVYFPLLLVMRRQGVLMSGLLLGVFIVISVAFLFAPLAVQTYTDWFSGNMSVFPNGFSRVSLNAHVLMPVAMVWGMLYLADTAQPRLHRIIGFMVLLASTFALAITFTRGIFTGVALVLMCGLILGLLVPRTRPLRWRALGAAVLLIPLTFTVMFWLSPGGAARFFNLPGEIASLAPEFMNEESASGDPLTKGGANGELQSSRDQSQKAPETRSERIRQEQARVLVNQWQEEPWFGNGAGAMPERYEETGRTNFELEYHALLYRSGAVGIAVAVLLLAFLGFRYLAVLRWRSNALFLHQGKAAFSMLVAALVVAIVGYVNPVLTSAYFGFLVALYLALSNSLWKSPPED